VPPLFLDGRAIVSNIVQVCELIQNLVRFPLGVGVVEARKYRDFSKNRVFCFFKVKTTHKSVYYSWSWFRVFWEFFDLRKHKTSE